MKFRFVLLVVMILIVTFGASNKVEAEEYSSRELVVKEFSFEGIKLGMDIKEVEKNHKRLTILEGECDTKTKQQVIMYYSDAASSVTCCFFGESVYEMRVIYLAEKMRKMGGSIALVNKITEKFGGAHDAVGEESCATNNPNLKFYWDFPDIERKIFVNITNQHLRMDVTDVLLKDEIIKLKSENMDAGF